MSAPFFICTMKVKVTIFSDNPYLNSVTNEILEADQMSRSSAAKAKEYAYDAFKYRWICGKHLHDNEDLIVGECGTQKNFAEVLGISESVLSNNKRGYKNLLEQGCDSWKSVISLLESKKINPIVSNFEKIGTLLNEPTKDTTGKQQTERDLKRLESIRKEADEILTRMTPAAQPKQLSEGMEAISDLEEIQKFLNRFNPYKSKWKNEKYLEFIRSFGWDMVKDEPCERCDPHHTTETGGSGSQGEKLADFFAIPVSRETHNEIESGMLVPHPEEILKIQFYCLSAFIKLNLK